MASEEKWLSIRNEYITGSDSYRLLAEKYGEPAKTVSDRGAREGWKKARKEYRENLVKLSGEKTAEKTAEAESEIASIRARLRLKIMQQLENRMDEEALDGMEFRRLVQSYKDMCELTDGIGGQDENNDGFLEALNGTAEEDWSDESDIPV